jgi:hypothetical protein
MSDAKQVFKIGYANNRARAVDACRSAPHDWTVTIAPPSKTRDQEERYHAMIGDVCKQCTHLNKVFDAETWKRLLIDQFKRDTLKEPECCAEYWRQHSISVIPSLDGAAVVILGEQSRRFPKKVASVFVEWLYAYGAEREVKWSDPTQPPVEAYQ